MQTWREQAAGEDADLAEAGGGSRRRGKMLRQRQGQRHRDEAEAMRQSWKAEAMLRMGQRGRRKLC